MFTGIVQALGKITQIKKSADGKAQTNWVKLPQAALKNLQIGASVANNGCCLTITSIEGDVVSFDLIDETLAKTNLGELKVGDLINIERSLKFGDEIGGHVMSGHITATVTITAVDKTENNTAMTFAFPRELKEYVLPKGFIGLDGCSLTVGEVTDTAFSIHLIPETLRQTIFRERKVGDRVNLEIDPQTQLIVRTVKEFLAARS